MLRGARTANAVQEMKRHRHVQASAGHVVSNRRFVGDLRPRQIGKARGAEIDERMRTGHRGAGAERGNGGFRGRRIDHPVREIVADAVHQLPLRTEPQHIAADNAGARIGAQSVVQRFDERGRECAGLAHDA